MRIKLPINGFIVGVFLSVIAAYLFPDLGAKGGLFISEITTKLGVIIIFFFQGLQLPSEKMIYDLMEWKLHLFIQSFNFIFIPAIVLILNLMVGSQLPKDLQIGFLYLAILPTTIATAVVFSGLVGGNQIGAIFNAALSNILAVFIVPAWTTWHLSTTVGLDIPLLPLLAKLSLLLILPFIVGQVLRPWLKGTAIYFKTTIRRISIGIILFILYSAFCNSFKKGVWQEFGLNMVLTTFSISFILLGLIMIIVWSSVNLVKFQYPSKMTAFFCGSQKSLATGVPMASSIFAAANNTQIMPELGVVLLPLMFFHPLQLFIGSLIVGKFSKKN